MAEPLVPENYSITLDVERRGTLWTVTSPQIRGLLVAGHSMSEVLANTSQAIVDLQRADGVQ
jgi:predicted RNase H-like HicB family nuclease